MNSAANTDALNRLTDKFTAYPTWSALTAKLSTSGWRPSLYVRSQRGRNRTQIRMLIDALLSARYDVHTDEGWRAA